MGARASVHCEEMRTQARAPRGRQAGIRPGVIAHLARGCWSVGYELEQRPVPAEVQRVLQGKWRERSQWRMLCGSCSRRWRTYLSGRAASAASYALQHFEMP